VTALTLLAAAAALLILQCVTFVVALKAGKHSVVDTAWGIGIALAALAAFVVSLGHGDPARRALLLAASVVWGLRLAAHVGWRNHGKPEDPRYADMLWGRTNLYALRMVYLLQAAILWLATVPVQLGMLERSPAGPLVVIGALLFAVGFAFESVGDWQLARFKATAADGQIMDRGLWRYTRHPNYFGDFCMWWGLFAISYGSWQELPALVAPLLMTFILTRGTGASMTDRRMKASRPGYADYVERTSGFIPLPPKRRASAPIPGGRG
jgi:steroid 5-alpha reductase family enzyme